MDPRTRQAARSRVLRLWIGVVVLGVLAASVPVEGEGGEGPAPRLVCRAPAGPIGVPESPVPASPPVLEPEPGERLLPDPAVPRITIPAELALALVPGLTAPTVRSHEPEPRRVRLGDDHGRTLVAREYGGPDSRMVLLPDGRLGWPNAPIYTDDPFRPFSPDDLREYLLDGPYKHYRVHQTDHYLVFYQGSEAFARDSGTLLESLYLGLLKGFREHGLEVHDAEFPLVAVIFRKESDFREHRRVAADVQAYYEVLSNRIFFYEARDRDLESASAAAMRKPQTVAHEGTHQVLSNIGVQPRMAPWPAWLVEGLAEFCAPTVTNRGAWAGFSRVNPFHLATIQELQDSLAIQGGNGRLTRAQVGRAFGQATVDDLIAREELSPTDYALAWALTFYLANKKHDEFVTYLKEMGRMPPFAEHSAESRRAAFRTAFKDDPPAIGQQAHRLISGIRRADNLPHYAVSFEQPIEPGVVRLGTLVSQSPQVIRQWIEQMGASHSAAYYWEAWPFPNRAAATAAAERWINSR